MFDQPTNNLAPLFETLRSARAADATIGETPAERDANVVRDGLATDLAALGNEPVHADFATASDWRKAHDAHSFATSKLTVSLDGASLEAGRLSTTRRERDGQIEDELQRADLAWRRGVAESYRDKADAAFTVLVEAMRDLTTINGTFPPHVLGTVRDYVPSPAGIAHGDVYGLEVVEARMKLDPNTSPRTPLALLLQRAESAAGGKAARNGRSA